MTRYVRRPVAYVYRDSDDAWHPPDDPPRDIVTVFEDDKRSFSGLYDADGTPLYRDDSRPIGFVREL